MKYEFPIIRDLDDVLFAIKDSPEFIVVEKDDYIVINYVVMNEETFPIVDDQETDVSKRLAAMIRRECRGLIFDKNGSLINRRFHKFFNVNEREETRLEAIDWSKPHMILEKLDGSMVSPCLIDGHIRWMTKMGITDTSMEAEVFVAKNPKYTDFAKIIMGQGCTPIFEWCSNKNRIVLDYPEDCLVLTAIRHNETGKYVPHSINAHNGWGIPVVKAWSNEQIEKMGTLINIIRQQEDAEGVVVRFEDGHMVKIKTDWYVRIHKVKSALENEREVVHMILNNQLDDLLPVLPKEDIDKIKRFENELKISLAIAAFGIRDYVAEYRTKMDRKTFALQYAPAISPMWRGIIFQFWDKEVNTSLTYQAIVDIILKHSLSNQSYRKVKEEFLKDVKYE